MTHDMQHFVRLARQGKSSGASPGEKLAREIAVKLLDGPCLDDVAIHGIADFALAVKRNPFQMAEEIGHEVDGE